MKRCIATTKSGGRCRNAARYGSCCSIHKNVHSGRRGAGSHLQEPVLSRRLGFPRERQVD